MNKMQEVSQVREEISYTWDGPVTPFVLISRAMDKLKAGREQKVVEKALYEELLRRGFLEQEHDF